jgi:hypothetical protein
MPACLQISCTGCGFPEGRLGRLHTFVAHLFSSPVTASQLHFPTVTGTNSNPCGLINLTVPRASLVYEEAQRMPSFVVNQSWTLVHLGPNSEVHRFCLQLQGRTSRVEQSQTHHPVYFRIRDHLETLLGRKTMKK